MSDTSLPWRLLGRLIKPYAFALTASLLSVWIVSIRHAEALDEMHSRHGHTVGWIAPVEPDVAALVPDGLGTPCDPPPTPEIAT